MIDRYTRWTHVCVFAGLLAERDVVSYGSRRDQDSNDIVSYHGGHTL
jgi:hypothetical protein